MELEFTAKIIVNVNTQDNDETVEKLKEMGEYLKRHLGIDDYGYKHSPIKGTKRVSIKEIVEHDDMLLREEAT